MAPPNADAFLTEALSRTGPNALPYNAEFAFVAHQQLLELVGDFPALRLKAQPFTHPDGRTSILLCAEGTVPMHYGGNKYNIPVAIWLPEKYPLQRPIVYVVPTHNMIIKPRHSFVDACGLVATPYLNNWAYPRSTLHDMAQDMAMLFGSDPPLFSKPTHPSAAPPPSSFGAGGGGGTATRPGGSTAGSADGSGSSGRPSPTSSGHAFVNPMQQVQQGSTSSPFATLGGPFGTSSSTGHGSGIWGAAVDAFQAGTPSAVQPSPQKQQQKPSTTETTPPAPPPKHTQESLLSAFRTAAVAELTARLQASLAVATGKAAAEAHKQMDQQAELRRREATLQQEVQALQAERLALDKKAHDLSASNQQLEAWLAENEARAAAMKEGSLDPDSMLTAADPLSQQALGVKAEDLALEDCLYELDKALQAGRVAPEAYLRQVRAVCRRQFIARVLGLKIAEQQRHAAAVPQGTHGAVASAVGAPMVMPQGDSWSTTTGMLANPLAAQHL